MTTPDTFALALAHHQAGRLAEAEALYRQILTADPGHAEAWQHLGILAHQAGDHARALDWLGQAVMAAPANHFAHANLGEACRAAGRLDEAAASYRRALGLQPDHASIWQKLGMTLMEQGKFGEAIGAYRRVVELEPASPEAHHQLANALKLDGQIEKARATFCRALELKPDFAVAHCLLGNTFREFDQWDEASACYEQALAVAPGFPLAHLDIGVMRFQQGRFEEAAASFQRAIASAPDFAQARINLGLLLLLLGRYEEGWHEYQWRSRTPARLKRLRQFAVPPWTGSAVPGQTIFIHAEQGFGDTLLFLRYLPLVLSRSRAARVIFECPPPLLPLLTQLESANLQIISHGNFGRPLPPFDLQLPLFSLPAALQRFSPLPMTGPPLQAGATLRARWREWLGSHKGIRVGLAWAGNPVHGNDRRRSIDPLKLSPLLDQPQIQWVRLLVDSRQPLPPSFAGRVLDLTAQISNFADSAALIAELDLVITVDTATAHLAGVLGKPVWVLLPFVPDWRWGLSREDTPWYPTMRLFRQATANDWETVIARVSAALREWPGTAVGQPRP